ncbi:unnamed protein product [Thelazia callipaeda]|uniref:DH domain-containing protein n=1 Tax=Thelazia callipaeda TaxID=103827 RepID=A0A0N5CWW3_THECL|nr:unnamed protein product [Thelazia callipaeda]
MQDDDVSYRPIHDSIHNIISRFEYEEDKFLRELEELQKQVTEKSSSTEEVPILGALCSLVGEIGKLRRENKALRHQLNSSIESKRGVVHRVSALLEGKANIIPRFMGQRAIHRYDVQTGARERLSTPPHKESLTTSSYSTDISSDLSDPNRLTLLSTTKNVPPTLILPKMSDSDVEHSIFTEANNVTREGRAGIRRSKVLSVLERRSPSSASSRDHSENMTSSQSSFFEIIGLTKKKKEKSTEIKKDRLGSKIILKKRKRKISESNSVQSSENNANDATTTSTSNTTSNRNIYVESSDDNRQSFLQIPKQYHLLRQKEEERAQKCLRSKNSTAVSEENDDSYRRHCFNRTSKSIADAKCCESRLLLRPNYLSNRESYDISNRDERIRQLLEIMPSYDALYSFTISVVRKLGRLRASYIEKNMYANRSDFEVMHAQSSLLITHSQLERLKLQLQAVSQRRIARPASYHGEDLLQKMIKPEINFLLPLKLHGSRIRKHHRSVSCAMESEAEENEQSIENEFLRLFDYARCLSRISECVTVKKTSVEKVGIPNSSLKNKNDLSSTAVIRKPNKPGIRINYSSSPTRPQEQLKNCFQRNRKIELAARPVSLVETEGRTLTVGDNTQNSPGYVVKKSNVEGNAPLSLNLHPLISQDQTQTIVSSLQDIRNHCAHSPHSTPLMMRRINERSRNSNQHGLADSFAGNQSATCDIPLSQSNASSDYVSIITKQIHTSPEKQPTTPKRSLLSNYGSKLRHPTSSNYPIAAVSQLVQENVHANNSDNRNICRLRRNPEVAGMIKGETSVTTTKISAVPKIFERSRLPKISTAQTEKKRGSWLSRIKAVKK